MFQVISRIPFLLHTAGFRKESLTYSGQALYSLLTDVAEGLAGTATLRCSLQDFISFFLTGSSLALKESGNWMLLWGASCFPGQWTLIRWTSTCGHHFQMNFNLWPPLPSAPVTVSSFEQSVAAWGPMPMILYAVAVSVCAPIWLEIIFRGFLLPSLTRYIHAWLSSVAFAMFTSICRGWNHFCCLEHWWV